MLRDLPSDAAFALRTSAASLLALYLAMSLHLDTPRWAAWTVLTVSVPSLDHAFVKSFYRMIGTIMGAAAGIVIVALFAQRPLAFDLAMALWAGACAFVGTRVRQYQTYALALTWLTTGIVSYGSVADPNGAFIVAANLTAQVALGILCAG
ncbi:MAG: FUSC family protein, partial [Rhodospirillales bacterium]|nr:FUSC family protein [Rhodospirillales bacterium]